MKRCACVLLSCRHTCGGKMVKIVQHGVDKDQVKKAVQALLAYQKTKEKANSLLLNEHDQMLLLLTVWKIPNQAKVIRIPLPHGIREDTSDVCLFTRDEPNMSSDQTEKFYKKLLSQHGVKQITEIIPLKKMKKEYKQFEAKRRLLSSFDLFLADARIRRLLPSHIGKHFYKEKREPESVNLKHNNLAAELNRHIQGTRLHINTKGCCYAVRVGHIGMKVEDLVENTLAVARVIAEKLPEKWKNVKVLHLKTQSSVALPIYTSSFDSLEGLNLIKAEKEKIKKKKKSAKERKPVTSGSEQNGDHVAEEKQDTKKSAEESKQATSGSEETEHLIAKEKKNTKKSIKESKLVTSGSEETGEQKPKQKKDKLKSAQKSKPATSGSEEIKDQISEEKKDTKKSAKKSKPASSGSKKSGDQIAKEKKDTATPRKGQNQPDEEEEEIPQLIPIQEPSSAKRKKKKEIDVQEESKMEEKSDGPEENVEVPSSSKRTLRKRKVNESEEVVKTPNKHKKDLASEEEREQPEKQETPPKRDIAKKTPKKTASTSAAKLTKSARKAPQTPKLRQKKKMKPPQSV